ncbi:MAG: type IV pilus secretin PilQ [Gammaproteobacteria bacterium]
MNKASWMVRIFVPAVFCALALIFPLTVGQTSENAPTLAGSDSFSASNADLRLSLQLQDAPVRDLLQLLAHQKGISVLVSDEVSGTLSLNLVEVAWPDAWSTVLSAAGLAERVGQGIRFVAPAEMLAAQETQALSDAQTVEQLAPLQTVVLRVRYARANLLHKYLAAEKAGLSERGRVFVDERLNALIIRDLPGRLDSLRRLVELLDVPLSQVAIEARIVTASDSLNQQLGVAWQAAFRSAGSAGGAAKVGTGSINSVVASTALSTASPASTLSLGVLRPGVAIDARLSSLVEQGRARVLAKPKILTIDQSLASIQSGVQIPYQETSRSGATSTSFKDAVLSLHVRHLVTPDGNILMQIEVKQDTVGQIFNGVPSINTNEMQTNVLVGNGQTLVLGGILQEDENDARRKTPIFGDLPVVGRLFRRKIKRKDQQELLVFITPTLVPDSPALANLKAEALAVPE